MTADDSRSGTPPAGDSTPARAPFPVVGIGASAGGLEAFRTFLEHLPADTGMAFVLIPHLAPKHESLMSEILSRNTGMPVQEVTQDETPLQSNHVFVIKPNTMLSVNDGRLRVEPQEDDDRRRRACVDHFLTSLAQVYQERAIAVILSGTASDGSIGCRAVKQAGGITFAQDESAQFQDMPRNALATGCVDFVLPPRGIAEEIGRIARHPYVAPPPKTPSQGPEAQLLTPDPNSARRILSLLHGATGVDFTQYKPTTVYRRIARRMALRRVETYDAYLAYLEDHPPEVKALHDDILINVTSFFREPESYEALRDKIFPALLKDRASDDAIRVWVPGCSSGEEVYSLAILLLEFLERERSTVPVQIFGTDVSDVAVERARAGIYDASIQADLSSDRLGRFFTRTDRGGFQIAKHVRDVCVFARQDLSKDPPFSRLDLLSCRNVLIYLGGPLQKRIFSVFHYALRPKGYLALGSSETVGTFAQYFTLVDKVHKIYSKVPTTAPRDMDLMVPVPSRMSSTDLQRPWQPPAPPEFDLQKETDRLLLARYFPAGITIDPEGNILHVRGDTGDYLRPSPGRPSSNLLKMAREDLVFDLEAALREAKEKGAIVRKEGIRLRSRSGMREIGLEVAPVPSPASRGPYFLVLFHEQAGGGAAAAPADSARAKDDGEGAEEVARVRRDFGSLKEYHQSVVEKLESANEELRSAHEEVLSGNEELRSTNEELETSKEELQATNEELATLNEELGHRNTELGEANSDLQNLFASLNIPVAFVDAGLRLRRFTPAAEKLFKVIPADVNRRITDFQHSLELNDLEALIQGVLETLIPIEREVRDRDGRWYSLQVRPYRTLENRIEGALILVVDVDPFKKSLVKVEQERDLLYGIIHAVPEPLLILEPDLRVRMANESFLRAFRVSPAETEDRPLWELGHRQWDIPELRVLLGDVLPKAARVDNFLLDHDFPTIGRKSMVLHARQISYAGTSRPLILVTIVDVTEQRRVRGEIEDLNRNLERRVGERTAELKEALQELDGFSYSVSHDLRAPLRAMSTFSDLLLEEGKILDPEGRVYVQRISEAARRLDTLVNDLLTYGRVGRMGVTLEDVELGPVVRDVLGQMAMELKERQAEVSVAEPLPRVRAHGLLLAQALTILLSNAVKFVAPGVAPRVAVRAERRSAMVRLWVEDNGIGIPVEQQHLLFAVFQRLNTGPAYPGTGIGLAIVRRAVERMGGEIGLESEPGRGSRFFIDLSESRSGS